MERNIAQLEILKIVQHIIWLISALFLGYIIGQAKVYKDLLKEESKNILKRKDNNNGNK